MRVEWRCASTGTGVPSVTTTGAREMQPWCADSWAMLVILPSPLFIYLCIIGRMDGWTDRQINKLSTFFLLLFSLPTSLPLSPGVVQTFRNSYFGAGSYSMLVGHLYCYGSEPQLSDCYGFTYTYFYGCNPSSSHVAGVRCIGKYTVVCKSIEEYARVCKSIQKYRRVYCSIQEYVRVCKSMLALSTPVM